MAGKYSPTVIEAYTLSQVWFPKHDLYDVEGYDMYGYDKSGVDRTGYREHDYYGEEGENLFDILQNKWTLGYKHGQFLPVADTYSLWLK